LPIDITVQSIRPEGKWTGPASMPLQPRPGGVAGNIELEVPAAQPYSQPYWLLKPPSGECYTVDDQMLIGLPDSPTEQMRIQLTVAGVPIEIARAIENRYNDRAEAERIRALTVVPPLSANPSSAVAMFAAPAARSLHILVKANVANADGE